MEVQRVVVTALLLLLQFNISCEDAISGNKQPNIASQLPPESLCEGDTCHVSSPDDFWYLQNIIHSNRVIILNGLKFSVDENNGFVVVENVSNLTISGGESGSSIECSPQSASFGIHIKNSTNVTLTRLRITHCGSSFPEHLMQCCSTSLLIEASRSIVLSEIHIENSLYSLAVVLNDEYPESPFFFSNSDNPSLRLTNCTISYDTNGIWVHGITSVLIEKTVLTVTSIESYMADIMIQDVDVIQSEFSLEAGRVMIKEKLTMNQSLLIIVGQDLHIHGSKILFYESETSFRNITEMSIVNSSVVFRKYYSALFNSSVTIKHSAVTFTESEYGWSIRDSQIYMKNASSLVLANNSPRSEDYGLTCETSLWKMSPDSDLLVTENKRFPIIFSSTNISLSGAVRIANNDNNNTFFGPVNLFTSTIRFTGSLEVEGNSGGNAGGIAAVNSDLFLSGRATFSDNHGSNGGAVILSASFMYISPNASVDFIRNQAQRFGGAIYISDMRPRYICGFKGMVVSCSLRVDPSSFQDNPSACPLFSLTFTQNRAGVAGNAIYGGYTSSCIVNHCECHIPNVTEIFQYNGVNDSSDLSSFTSDPTRVCFCFNGVPNCHTSFNGHIHYPGEKFNLSLAIVGYGLGTVPGSVIFRNNASEGYTTEPNVLGEWAYSKEIRGRECQDMEYFATSEKDREVLAFAVDPESFLYSIDDTFAALRSVQDQLPVRFNKISFVQTFFHIPVFLEVAFSPCPVGFQLLRGSCVCHQILLDNNIDTCYFSNGAFILRRAPYWIGLPNNKNSSILIHPQCPFDYCKSTDLNILVDGRVDIAIYAQACYTCGNFRNTQQCQYHRSGVLCGSCREGLSTILGSSECKICSNVYLLSIGIFILVGMALVILLTLLNMTVSVGTLNGLILLANILQANRATFLPPSACRTSVLTTFLSVFISWLNLDLGIPVCFFDGLTTYFKTWLQFAFPLYILTLVGAMIVASNYSTRVTWLLGTNTVSVMATLILLSYAKILRILITAFSFTTITGSQGYHSVVWLADGNIKYFEPKHTVLFLVALFVLLLFGVPYTVTLTAAPWIQRSRFRRVSSLYNRFKPLFDAYMGPYKDSCRYWTGMLLLVRVVLIVLFSSLANTNTVAGPQLSLLLLVLSFSALLALTTAIKPYKNRLLNGLEVFHLSILLMFSSSNLYVSSIGTGIGALGYVYTILIGICFLVFLGICVGHVWYKVRKARTGRRPEPPEIEEEERYPLWHRARIRAEDEEEEREEVTLSTAGADISDGGFRDSALDLANLN